MLRLPQFRAEFPRSLDEAVSLKTRHGSESAFVAGGTDLYPNMKRRQQTPAVVIDVVARLLPGVLGNEASSIWESFSESGHGSRLLDCPQWTRPAVFRGIPVPEMLLSGHHEEIRKWRRKAAEEKTARMRPDLLQQGGNEISDGQAEQTPQAGVKRDAERDHSED